ncbi:MAG: metallophosphoesterase [Eubacterium sp.]|nr:metallophosphoesterase [Eubacterium sp.]
MKTLKKLNACLMALVMLTALFAPFSANAQNSRISPLDKNKVKLHCALWGDPQVSNYLKEREPYVISSAKDIKNSASRIDALVLAGDITENSIADEWEWVYNDIKDTGVKNYITATGNHDIRIHDYDTARESFTSFTNRLNKKAGSKLRINKLYYSYTLKGYKFIVLGSEKSLLEEAEISKKQLSWLDKELKDGYKKNHPTFVIVHQPLKNTHGLPDTWGSSIKSAGTVGVQSDAIKKILNKYAGTVLITGHLHTGFGKYTYQKIGNIQSVNLPSVAIDNEDGSYNDNGIGYMMEVYGNEIVFRARNFDKGVYVPKYDIRVNLYIKSAKLSKKTYKYDGKAKKPKVKIVDVYGNKVSKKYYKVIYPKGRKKPGTYKIKIIFKGKYKKAKPLTRKFKIKK